jgi:hypothetical protein
MVSMTVLFCQGVPWSLHVSRSYDVEPGEVEARRKKGPSKGLEANKEKGLPKERKDFTTKTFVAKKRHHKYSLLT